MIDNNKPVICHVNALQEVAFHFKGYSGGWTNNWSISELNGRGVDDVFAVHGVNISSLTTIGRF